MQWDIAIDIGGTFVDLVARPPDGGRWRSAKRLRGSADTADAIAEALLHFLDKEGVARADVGRLRHGTTIATNSLLELREPPVALVTTAGFADVLTLGRQNRRDLRQSFPQPPVPPHICPETMRFELNERVDARGHIVTPLSAEALCTLVDRIATSCGAQATPPAIAVCLLFAPLNPTHELAVAAALRARWPGVHLSLSHQVDPRLREFERTLSTLLDAYIRPAVSGYLQRLEETLAREHLPAPLIMRSMGGLAPSPACIDAPLTLAMSGPTAAAYATRDAAARHAGPAATAIGIDIGGTSTDICLVAEGSVLAASTLTLGALDVRVPSADIASVAIGGGSILQMAGGLLRVGPHSAGSNPGPACYGRGGMMPTLTDAALLAGLLPEKLGSELALDRGPATAAMMRGLAVQTDDLPAVAAGAVQVAEAMIAEEVRRKAFARGIDPRKAVLVAAGGGGALHAAEIGDRIGCRIVIVPPSAGVLAARGLMQAGLRDQTERPVEMPLADDAIASLADHAAEDADRLRETLAQWSGRDSGATMRHELEISYQGQGHSLAVAFDPGADDASSLAARFDALHERVRGHAFETRRRILALRSIATLAVGGSGDGATDETTDLTSARPREGRDPESGKLDSRVRGNERVEVSARGSLAPGIRLEGPALIDADDTTIWLPPGWRCDVAADGTLILTAMEPAP
jgi:N-methylhydantoinase A